MKKTIHSALWFSFATFLCFHSHAEVVVGTNNESTAFQTTDTTLTDSSDYGDGFITRELYYNIGGARIEILTSNPRYGIRPSYVGKRTSFEGDTNIADNYGSRLYGYLYAPITGDYIFYIAADDRAELWLSTDDLRDNKVLIASVESPVKVRDYTKYAAQTSVSISLVKGTKYYVEALHKEGSKSDHISVAWTMPDSSFENPIPGSRLSPAPPLPVGLEEEYLAAGRNRIKAYPMPAKEKMYLEFSSEASGNTLLVLRDAYSNAVGTKEVLIFKGINQIEWSLEGLPNGMYFIQVGTGQDQMIQKIIVAK